MLRIGYIPEHFSTPIRFAQEKGFFENHGVEVELIPYPSGSGHLIQSLKNDEIDIAVGLTEAFVAGICKNDTQYKIAGTYVESPLCWAISSGVNRTDINSPEELHGKRIGVSRIGSGSYIMSFVLALQSEFSRPYYKSFPVLHNFANLRDSVNLKEGVEPSDAFMWEHFTSKKYYDNGEIKRIGEIYTPWPSWVIVGSSKLEETQLQKALKAVQEGVDYFDEHKTEAVEHISTHLDYSTEDAMEWLKTVKFSSDVTRIDYNRSIVNTARILKTAGVVQQENEPDEVIDERLAAGISAIKDSV
ncbi:BA75_03119T0 [Komagataella pastoris]|uniref:BA75_03119T0 n=1 Tax=Komagataella pastoris TaxID=4922 RepID=A0A1B2JD83_PICPA|nr:BA75_03119T0 [Komagataella pastoris]